MFRIRHPIESDLPSMLHVEFERYPTFYKGDYKKKEQIEAKFRKRIEIAHKWMWVLLQDETVVGFISGQPTNEEPESFESWEKSTNNGTLEGTYYENGKNIYVVNLDVRRSATKMNGQYLLMAALGAKLVREGKEKVVFESRMPGFRDWLFKVRKMEPAVWQHLSAEQKLREAEKYTSLTTMKDGKEVLYDKLLRFYEGGGFTFVKVYPNAFEDNESLNFGVLCVGLNPVPRRLRVLPVNIVVSGAFRLIGKNQKLFEKFVG